MFYSSDLMSVSLNDERVIKFCSMIEYNNLFLTYGLQEKIHQSALLIVGNLFVQSEIHNSQNLVQSFLYLLSF